MKSEENEKIPNPKHEITMTKVSGEMEVSGFRCQVSGKRNIRAAT